MSGSVLYALGLGTLVNVAAAAVERVIRAVGIATDVSGDPVIAAVAAVVLVASRGASAGRSLALVALFGLASPASALAGRILSIAVTGRAVGAVAASTDAFAPAPRALVALAVALALGAALGAIARAYAVEVPDRVPRPPLVLARAVGAALVAGSVVTVLWPFQLLSLLLPPRSLLTSTLLALPLVVAGPLVGGAHAARNGATYLSIASIGAYLALPAALTLATQIAFASAPDPTSATLLAQARVAVSLNAFLGALRIGGWPIGAAVVHAFLVPRPSPATPG